MKRSSWIRLGWRMRTALGCSLQCRWIQRTAAAEYEQYLAKKPDFPEKENCGSTSRKTKEVGPKKEDRWRTTVVHRRSRVVNQGSALLLLRTRSAGQLHDPWVSLNELMRPKSGAGVVRSGSIPKPNPALLMVGPASCWCCGVEDLPAELQLWPRTRASGWLCPIRKSIAT